jgi:6-phosphogluconolactonase (cycloisomerase 2 family)
LKIKALASMSASFEAFCLASGIEALSEMMAHDAQTACGPRHVRGPDRQAHRWGKTKGKIGFHGGMIEIERPRLRGFDSKERALPSWEAAVAEDWLGKWAMNQMLINVSTRKFKRSVRLPEVFVADGYGNRRVIVFDAATGAYKRHWGAYGNKPDDKAPRARQTVGPAPQQFNTPHGIAVSNDDIVYVADRANNRVQTFTLDGAFIKEAFVRRESKGTGTAFGVALSADPQQRFLYVADGSNERIAILDRASLEEIGQIGGPGRKAGEFFHLHSLGVDPQGNLVTGESQGYRVQKFIFKGLTTAAR